MKIDDVKPLNVYKSDGTQTYQQDRVYLTDGISIALTASFSDRVLIADSDKCEPVAGQFQPIDRDYNKNGGKRVVQFEKRKDGLSNAVLTNDIKNCVSDYSERIRKLTPRECWRLMDFSDDDFDKARASGMSDTQLYKQAGNSIVVATLEAIFRMML